MLFLDPGITEIIVDEDEDSALIVLNFLVSSEVVSSACGAV